MFVYLIASHENEAALLRLTRRIEGDSPTARIVVHHDRKGALTSPDLRAAARVEFVADPIDVCWGGFSMVELVLHCVRRLLEDPKPFDWVVLLSAQDYPVGPLARFEARTRGAGYDGYLDYEPASDAYAAQNVSRYEFQYVRAPRRFARIFGRLQSVNPFPAQVQFSGGRGGAKIGFRARKTPFGPQFRCYRGAYWWTLSRACVEYLADFAQRNPKVVDYYRRTLHPDESFVQTVLANAGRFRLCSDYGRYIRWGRPTDSSPRTLTAADFPAIINSGAAFARKFDPRIDSAVLDELDRFSAGAA